MNAHVVFDASPSILELEIKIKGNLDIHPVSCFSSDWLRWQQMQPYFFQHGIISLQPPTTNVGMGERHLSRSSSGVVRKMHTVLSRIFPGQSYWSQGNTFRLLWWQRVMSICSRNRRNLLGWVGCEDILYLLNAAWWPNRTIHRFVGKVSTRNPVACFVSLHADCKGKHHFSDAHFRAADSVSSSRVQHVHRLDGPLIWTRFCSDKWTYPWLFDGSGMTWRSSGALHMYHRYWQHATLIVKEHKEGSEGRR